MVHATLLEDYYEIDYRWKNIAIFAVICSCIGVGVMLLEKPSASLWGIVLGIDSAQQNSDSNVSLLASLSVLGLFLLGSLFLPSYVAGVHRDFSEAILRCFRQFFYSFWRMIAYLLLAVILMVVFALLYALSGLPLGISAQGEIVRITDNFALIILFVPPVIIYATVLIPVITTRAFLRDVMPHRLS